MVSAGGGQEKEKTEAEQWQCAMILESVQQGGRSLHATEEVAQQELKRRGSGRSRWRRSSGAGRGATEAKPYRCRDQSNGELIGREL